MVHPAAGTAAGDVPELDVGVDLTGDVGGKEDPETDGTGDGHPSTGVRADRVRRHHHRDDHGDRTVERLDQRDDGRDDGEAEREERRSLPPGQRRRQEDRRQQGHGLTDRRGHDRLVVATDPDLCGLQPDRDDQRDRQQAIPVPSQDRDGVHARRLARGATVRLTREGDVAPDDPLLRVTRVP